MTHSSIESVQDAEGKAKSIVEIAEKQKSDRISKAQEKAAEIVSAAEAKAKTVKEEMLRNAGEEITKSREKGIAEAKELAKRIEKTVVSKDKIRKIGSKAAKEILG